jgi:hypothetical protein
MAIQSPLDESIQRIREVYVNKFEDEPEWWFVCWLDLTERGQKFAEATEANAQDPRSM